MVHATRCAVPRRNPIGTNALFPIAAGLLDVQAASAYNAGMQYTLRKIPKAVDKALRDLSHSPKVSLVSGIARTIDWMRDVYVSKKALVRLEEYL